MRNYFQLKLIKTFEIEWFILKKNNSKSTESQLQFYWLRPKLFPFDRQPKTFGVSKSPRNSQEIKNLAPKNFSRFPKKSYYESFPDNTERKNFFLFYDSKETCLQFLSSSLCSLKNECLNHTTRIMVHRNWDMKRCRDEKVVPCKMQKGRKDDESFFRKSFSLSVHLMNRRRDKEVALTCCL